VVDLLDAVYNFFLLDLSMSNVVHTNEVALRRARLVLRWVTVHGYIYRPIPHCKPRWHAASNRCLEQLSAKSHDFSSLARFTCFVKRTDLSRFLVFGVLISVVLSCFLHIRYLSINTYSAFWLWCVTLVCASLLLLIVYFFYVHAWWYVTSHSGQLSFLLSAGWEMSTGQGSGSPLWLGR